jgi:hypothetical protein
VGVKTPGAPVETDLARSGINPIQKRVYAESMQRFWAGFGDNKCLFWRFFEQSRRITAQKNEHPIQQGAPLTYFYRKAGRVVLTGPG